MTGGSVIYEGLEITVEKLREIGFREFRLFPLWNRAGDNEVKAKALSLLLLPPFRKERRREKEKRKKTSEIFGGYVIKLLPLHPLSERNAIDD